MTKLRTATLELDALRALWTEHLPWSPFDFVPEVSAAGDRELHAERLCGAWPEENDFRFLAKAGRGRSVWLWAERLAWDSEFFGQGVARLHGVWETSPPLVRADGDYRKPLARLLERLSKRDVRYLFAAVDPRDLPLLRSLGQLGFSLVETRYFHYGPVNEPVLDERYPVRRAVAEDIPSLARAARGAVNPFDRFHADPWFEPEAVGRLMEHWIAESVAGRMADVVIVPDVPEPQAFVTYRYHRQHWQRWGVPLAQGVLSAVAPEFRGWLGKLGPEVAYHLYQQGVRFSCGSTQVTNRPIIWLAQEAGARYGRCEHLLRKVL